MSDSDSTLKTPRPRPHKARPPTEDEMKFLKNNLRYDQEAGLFYNATLRITGGPPVGSVMGWSNPRGYVYVSAGNRPFQAHRVAWYFVHGVWPPGQIDHINRITSDNRIANLRMATPSLNQLNQGLRSSSTTGVRGVSRFGNGCRAQIKINGRSKHIGLFASLEEAGAAYESVRKAMI
jgi:hypothetical protein